MTSAPERLRQPLASPLQETRFSRRDLLKGAGSAGLAAIASRPSFGQTNPAQTSVGQSPAPFADHTIRIAPISLEIGPNKIIKTTGYNDTVPGPLLRLKEGAPVTIKVVNDSGYPNLVHWHGLIIPSVQDGTTEEGSPIIPPGQSLLYSFTPKPSGTRWYHSHAMAMTDLTRSTYSGEFGFLIVDPAAGDPGRYDREVMLAARRWEGSWVSMQDMRKGPPPDNGLEIMYGAGDSRRPDAGAWRADPRAPGRTRAVPPAERQRHHGRIARFAGTPVHRDRAGRQPCADTAQVSSTLKLDAGRTRRRYCGDEQSGRLGVRIDRLQ